MTLPLKVGPKASPSFITPRFKKDAWVTDDVLKSRGSSFDFLDAKMLAKLERPSLVSSAHGRIARVLMTLPWYVFLSRAEDAAGIGEPIPDDEWDAIETTGASLRSILHQLPEDTRFIILVHEEVGVSNTHSIDSTQRLGRWLEHRSLAQRVEIVRAPATMKFSMWAEDAYAASRDLADDELYLVEPASFGRGDDAMIADIVAPHTDLECTKVKLYFQGGNVLIGDDFWLIGTDYPNNSRRLGYVTEQPGETPLAAAARAYGAALDHARRFITIGSRLPVPGHVSSDGHHVLVRPFHVDGEQWEEWLYFGNAPGTVQPMFHIDMFITLGGRDPSGEYLVAVGDPRMAAALLGEKPQRHAMVEVFDDIADQLATLGFRVIRTPLPLTYDDDAANKRRTWYFATSNNALVQTTDGERHIWLPTYGHRKWQELRATDDENRRIWDREGFIVHQLGDFHAFAANLGAAHCVKKYLARG